MALRKKTIDKIRAVLLECKENNITIYSACKKLNEDKSNFLKQVKKLIKEAESGITELQEIVNLYEVTNVIPSTEVLDTDNHIEASYERDEENKIIYYKYRIYKKNKPALDGKLTREEMAKIMRMYTYEGGGFTAKVVSREFPQFSVQDIKRIFKAFAIYKDSCPFAPHDIEEKSIEELRDIQLREKENDFMRKAEEERIKNNEKLLRKYANENIELKKQLNDKKELIQELFQCEINIESIEPIINTTNQSDIIIFLSDLHIGAFNEKYGYIKLENYDEQEISRRLNKIIENIKNNTYHSITVCNLGDSVDSYNKQTTRGGHELPTILSNKEQSQMYLKIMLEFFNKLFTISEEISYICIGESNHDGDWGWINNVVLAEKLEKNFNIKTYISSNPIDKFDINDVSVVYLHGKDNKNQFKGFPLTLDFKTESWFNSYFIDSDQQFKKKKCIVKGDLHQYAYTCAKHFDYISAPSLYGSSNWITSNFGKTPWGVLIMEIDSINNIKTYIIKD